jgi:hypothetical protein
MSLFSRVGIFFQTAVEENPHRGRGHLLHGGHPLPLAGNRGPKEKIRRLSLPRRSSFGN